LSHFDSTIYGTHEYWKNKLRKSPVRIQWDPEKDIHLSNLNYRSIQIGLAGVAVNHYVNEWTLSIEDITPLCKKIHSLVMQNKIEEAKGIVPNESIYPLPSEIKRDIGCS